MKISSKVISRSQLLDAVKSYSKSEEMADLDLDINSENEREITERFLELDGFKYHLHKHFNISDFHDLYVGQRMTPSRLVK
jgi:hypothetical protein